MLVVIGPEKYTVAVTHQTKTVFFIHTLLLAVFDWREALNPSNVMQYFDITQHFIPTTNV
jgi:hypothetical protein